MIQNSFCTINELTAFEHKAIGKKIIIIWIKVRNSLFSLQCPEPDCLCNFRKLFLKNHHWDSFWSRVHACNVRISIRIAKKKKNSILHSMFAIKWPFLPSAGLNNWCMRNWEWLLGIWTLECNSRTICKKINGNVAKIEEPLANAYRK